MISLRFINFLYNSYLKYSRENSDFVSCLRNLCVTSNKRSLLIESNFLYIFTATNLNFSFYNEKQVVQQNVDMKIFQRILHVTKMKKYLEVSHCAENLNQRCLGWLVVNHLMELLIQPKLININTHIHSIERSLLMICVEKLFLIKPQDFIISLVHQRFS